MARLNELLGAAAQYSKGLAAMFNLQEQEGVPTMAPELVPTSDIHARPEQWALHGGTLLWGFVDTTPAGGNFGQVDIVPGIGELVIVEDVTICNSVAAVGQYTLNISDSSPTFSSTGNLVARDARRIVSAGGGGASGTRIFQNTAAFVSSASQVGRFFVPAQTPTRLPLDVVLVSPWVLRLNNVTANERLLAHFRVRIRAATPRELAIGSL